MSSLNSNYNENAESVHFKIKDSDLSQFYKTNCGQEFASKALSINNIHFQVYIYPNGRKKEHYGYIQFIAALTAFDSNIKSISVCYQLYCPELHVMCKEVQKLHKVGDIMRWSPYQVDIFQHQHAKNLNFFCHIELLRKKEKTNGLRRKLSLQSMRRESSLSLPSIENVLQPQSLQMKTHVDIQWTMSYKMIYLFCNANNSASYCTQTINNMWSLCIFPKGMKHKDSDNMVLLLKLMRLPPEIRSIEADVEIQSEKKDYVERRRDVLFSYDKTQEVFKLPFSTSLLNTVRAFKLNVMVKITKIYEDIGNKQRGRVITDSWSIFWFDQFQRETVYCQDIDYGQYHIEMDPNDVIPLSTNKLTRSHSWTSSFLGARDIVDHTLNDEEDEEKQKSSSQHAKTASTSWLTLPLVSFPSSSRFSSNSITSYHRGSVSSAPNVELLDIKEDVVMKDKIKWPLSLRSKSSNKTPKHHKVKQELWNKADDQMTNEDPMHNDTKNEENNVFFQKFKQWLAEDLQKGKYLKAFQSTGCADVRLIKHLTEETLVNTGVDKWDRKIILDEANNYKLAQEKFNLFMNEHIVFREFKSCLKRHGIFTIVDLQRIKSKQELQNILNISSDDHRLAEIWCTVHPTQYRLQSEMNELRQKYTEAMDAMDVFLQFYIKLQEKISAEKPNDQIIRMEQQQISMQKKYCARTKQHQSLLQRSARDISRSKSESALSLNEPASSPSHTALTAKSSGIHAAALNLTPGAIIHQLSDTQLTENVQPYHSSTSRTVSSGVPSTSSEMYDNSHRCSADQDVTIIKEVDQENSGDLITENNDCNELN